MADYHSLLTRAVANLPSGGTPATREAIYVRARKALIEQLRSLRPPLPESDIAREANALDAAIAQIEARIRAATSRSRLNSVATGGTATPPPGGKPGAAPPPSPKPAAPPARPSARRLFSARLRLGRHRARRWQGLPSPSPGPPRPQSQLGSPSAPAPASSGSRSTGRFAAVDAGPARRRGANRRPARLTRQSRLPESRRPLRLRPRPSPRRVGLSLPSPGPPSSPAGEGRRCVASVERGARRQGG